MIIVLYLSFTNPLPILLRSHPLSILSRLSAPVLMKKKSQAPSSICNNVEYLDNILKQFKIWEQATFLFLAFLPLVELGARARDSPGEEDSPGGVLGSGISAGDPWGGGEWCGGDKPNHSKLPLFQTFTIIHYKLATCFEEEALL